MRIKKIVPPYKYTQFPYKLRITFSQPELAWWNFNELKPKTRAHPAYLLKILARMFWHTILETIRTNAFARNLLLTETCTYLLDQTFVKAFRLPTQDVFVVCMEPHIDFTLYRICFVLAESWPTRTSFSSLYETRTHPFGVDATETDYRFRNHYTWWYKIPRTYPFECLLVSLVLLAGSQIAVC